MTEHFEYGAANCEIFTLNGNEVSAGLSIKSNSKFSTASAFRDFFFYRVLNFSKKHSKRMTYVCDSKDCKSTFICLLNWLNFRS